MSFLAFPGDPVTAKLLNYWQYSNNFYFITLENCASLRKGKKSFLTLIPDVFMVSKKGYFACFVYGWVPIIT